METRYHRQYGTLLVDPGGETFWSSLGNNMGKHSVLDAHAVQ